MNGHQQHWAQEIKKKPTILTTKKMINTDPIKTDYWKAYGQLQ